MQGMATRRGGTFSGNSITGSTESEYWGERITDVPKNESFERVPFNIGQRTLVSFQSTMPTFQPRKIQPAQSMKRAVAPTTPAVPAVEPQLPEAMAQVFVQQRAAHAVMPPHLRRLAARARVPGAMMPVRRAAPRPVAPPTLPYAPQARLVQMLPPEGRIGQSAVPIVPVGQQGDASAGSLAPQCAPAKMRVGPAGTSRGGVFDGETPFGPMEWFDEPPKADVPFSMQSLMVPQGTTKFKLLPENVRRADMAFTSLQPKMSTKIQGGLTGFGCGPDGLGVSVGSTRETCPTAAEANRSGFAKCTKMYCDSHGFRGGVDAVKVDLVNWWLRDRGCEVIPGPPGNYISGSVCTCSPKTGRLMRSRRAAFPMIRRRWGR